MKFIPTSLILVALLLSGCATDSRIVVSSITFDESTALKSCAPAPKPPSGTYTQKDVAKYVASLKYANSDCKRTLQTLNQEVVNYNTTLKNKNPAK